MATRKYPSKDKLTSKGALFPEIAFDHIYMEKARCQFLILLLLKLDIILQFITG